MPLSSAIDDLMSLVIAILHCRLYLVVYGVCVTVWPTSMVETCLPANWSTRFWGYFWGADRSFRLDFIILNISPHSRPQLGY